MSVDVSSKIIYFYPLFFGFATFFEAKAYKIRSFMKDTPAQGYNYHQKLNFLGRFGILFGMPVIGYGIDKNISLAQLLFVLGIANFFGMFSFISQGLKIIKLSKYHILWFIGALAHASGMHFLYFLADIYNHSRAMILMMSPLVNGIGTLIIIFLIESKIAVEIDQKKEHYTEYYRNQLIRCLAHGFSGIVFIILGSIYV